MNFGDRYDLDGRSALEVDARRPVVNRTYHSALTATQSMLLRQWYSACNAREKRGEGSLQQSGRRRQETPPPRPPCPSGVMAAPWGAGASTWPPPEPPNSPGSTAGPGSSMLPPTPGRRYNPSVVTNPNRGSWSDKSWVTGAMSGAAAFTSHRTDRGLGSAFDGGSRIRVPPACPRPDDKWQGYCEHWDQGGTTASGRPPTPSPSIGPQHLPPPGLRSTPAGFARPSTAAPTASTNSGVPQEGDDWVLRMLAARFRPRRGGKGRSPTRAASASPTKQRGSGGGAVDSSDVYAGMDPPTPGLRAPSLWALSTGGEGYFSTSSLSVSDSNLDNSTRSPPRCAAAGARPPLRRGGRARRKIRGKQPAPWADREAAPTRLGRGLDRLSLTGDRSPTRSQSYCL